MGLATDSNEQKLSLRLTRALANTYARYFHRLSVATPCTVPDSGPAIIACNHINYLDPVFLQVSCPRMITWMMAAEYYEAAGVTAFFRMVGAIPVQRSGRDLASMRAALRALEDGQVLGIFPEGRISPTRELLPFHAGIALLAIRSGAPVCPALIRGTQHGIESLAEACLNPQHATVRFGRPLRFDKADDHEDLERVTAAIRAAVGALHEGSATSRTR